MAMADDGRISVRFNKDEQDLESAFAKALAEERTRDEEIPEQAVAKKLMRRGLSALAEREHAAAIAQTDLAKTRAQVDKIAQDVRMLAAAMDAIREDLATTVLVLLQHAGKLDAAKAEKWVDQVFKS
jgi:outer membrane murein-binding lipoprotein Lpp